MAGEFSCSVDLGTFLCYTFFYQRVYSKARPGMNQITIVVIDDHPLFRQGVIDSFAMESDIKVIGEADNGETAIDLIRVLKPQVAVIDVNLPLINGQQVTRQIVGEKSATRVILLTAYDDAD